jgi:predicted anti-sigma-YlaC factor YlaD
MKCNKAEKLILLEDSGELTGRRANDVEAHLRRCAECRVFQQSIAKSRLAFQSTEEPGSNVVQDILRQARLNAPQRKPAAIFGLKPVLAMAASVLIGLGLFFSAFGPGKVGMELDVTETQLLESGDQFVNVMYSGLSEDNLAFNFLMTFEEG